MTFSEFPSPLPFEQLTVRIDPASLPFSSTAEASVQPFRGVIGQEGARDALAFGVAMARPGYNIFVSGEPGTGRLSLARDYLEEAAKAQATPADWLYLNNFAEPREPIALSLPAGKGKEFVAKTEKLVDSLFASFPPAFENPAYQRGKAQIERDFTRRYSQAVDLVEHHARQQNIALFRDGETISFVPMLDGKAANEEEFAAFPETDKEAFNKQSLQLQDYLTEVLAELPQWRRESSEQLRLLNQTTIDHATGPLFAKLAGEFAGHPGVLGYLESMRRDLLGKYGEQPQPLADRQPETLDQPIRANHWVERYAPRLMVSHAESAGVPVVFESNPTYQNLFGKVEYTVEQGLLNTHHRLICPGSLHQANGGYLIVEADKLAEEPHVWPALKRALKIRQILIDPPLADQSAPTTLSLSPQPIPVALKVVLIGDRDLYYLLQEMDDEFNELFRVLADFEDQLPRTDETVAQMVGLVKDFGETAGFAPLSAEAAARLIEYSGRQAEHQRRLSAHIGDIFELTAEADLLRRQEGASLIGENHVVAVLDSKDRRLGRISRRLLEEMLDGTILIGTDGQSVGRVNGLTVLELGGSRFGMPARFSSTVSPGRRGVIDIEREVELGQAIHSKGVMILSGYLAHQYAQDFPLAISATIALEQSYGYVDGDSAALAELLALISALTDLPVRQDLAVTGSINQYGEVQAVGGVNEKIEGFFKLCAARKLTGRQGVVIPAANVANLMLSTAVVDAVRQDQFAIYAVATVDQAISLFTGIATEEVSRLAVGRLREMTKWFERE